MGLITHAQLVRVTLTQYTVKYQTFLLIFILIVLNTRKI